MYLLLLNSAVAAPALGRMAARPSCNLPYAKEEKISNLISLQKLLFYIFLLAVLHLLINRSYIHYFA